MEELASKCFGETSGRKGGKQLSARERQRDEDLAIRIPTAPDENDVFVQASLMLVDNQSGEYNQVGNATDREMPPSGIASGKRSLGLGPIAYSRPASGILPAHSNETLTRLEMRAGQLEKLTSLEMRALQQEVQNTREYNNNLLWELESERKECRRLKKSINGLQNEIEQLRGQPGVSSEQVDPGSACIAKLQREKDNAFEALKKNIMQKIVNRLMRSSVIKAFDTWVQQSKDNRRMRVICTRVLLQTCNRTMSRVFLRWMDSVIEKWQIKAKALKLVQRLMSLALVQGFERWRDSGVEGKEMKAKARKVVQRLMNMQKVRAWERWLTNTQEQKRLRAAGSKVVMKMANATLFRAYHSWSFVLVDDKQMSEFACLFLHLVLYRCPDILCCSLCSVRWHERGGATSFGSSCVSLYLHGHNHMTHRR